MYILHVPKNTEKWLKSAVFWIFWLKINKKGKQFYGAYENMMYK